MPSVLDMLKGTEGARTGALLGHSEGSVPEMTEAELRELDRLALADAAVLRSAEATVKTLPRGYILFKCPGCAFERTGPPDGAEAQMWKSHRRRHSHARQEPERFTAPRG